MANELNFIQVKPPEFQQSPLVTAFNAFMQLRDKKYQRAKEARAEGREDKKLSLEEQKIASEEKLNVARAENLRLEKEKFQDEIKKDAKKQAAAAEMGQALSALSDEIQNDPVKRMAATSSIVNQIAAKHGIDQTFAKSAIDMINLQSEVKERERRVIPGEHGQITEVTGGGVRELRAPQKYLDQAADGSVRVIDPAVVQGMAQGAMISGPRPVSVGGGGSGPAMQPGKDEKDFLDDKHKYAQKELDQLARERDQLDSQLVAYQQKMAEIKAKGVFGLTEEDKTAAQQVPEVVRTLNAQRQVLIRRTNEKKMQLNELDKARLGASKGVAVDVSRFAHQVEPEMDQGSPTSVPPAVVPGATDALGAGPRAALGGYVPGSQGALYNLLTRANPLANVNMNPQAPAALSPMKFQGGGLDVYGRPIGNYNGTFGL